MTMSERGQPLPIAVVPATGVIALTAQPGTEPCAVPASDDVCSGQGSGAGALDRPSDSARRPALPGWARCAVDLRELSLDVGCSGLTPAGVGSPFGSPKNLANNIKQFRALEQ
jgi:hypothetical protein